MNKYEKAIRFNLKVAVIFYVVLVVVNLAAPVSGAGWFRPSPFSIAALVVEFFCVLAQRGYLKQRIPFAQLFVCRFLQGIFYAVAKLNVCNWGIFAGLVVADVFFVAFLLMDASSYYYVEEEIYDKK